MALKILPLCLLLLVGCDSTPAKTLTPEQEARQFLGILYPGTEFRIVCDEHTYLDAMNPCAAARVERPELPPIALWCHERDVSYTTCHLPGEEQ